MLHLVGYFCMNYTMMHGSTNIKIRTLYIINDVSWSGGYYSVFSQPGCLIIYILVVYLSSLLYSI